jgi:hypothetical protein
LPTFFDFPVKNKIPLLSWFSNSLSGRDMDSEVESCGFWAEMEVRLKADDYLTFSELTGNNIPHKITKYQAG